MKVEIFGKELKNAVERVSCLMNKSKLNILNCVLLEVKDNTITFSATNVDQSITVTVDGVAVEDGWCFLAIEDLKKVYTMSDWITIYMDGDSTNVIFRNNKKKSMIYKYSYKLEEMLDIKIENPEDILKISESEFIYSFSDLCTFTAKSNTTEIMKCINLNLNKERMAAIDGQRLAIKEIKAEFLKSEGEYNVPVIVQKHIKKIANNKGGDLLIKSDGKALQIYGDDFVYTTKLVVGKFFDVDKTMNIGNNNLIEFKVNATELAKIAKEYSKINSKDVTMPMALMLEDGQIKTFMGSGNYETSDVVDYSGDVDVYNESSFFYAISPAFLYDSLNLFGDENVNFKCNIRMKGKNGYISSPILIYKDEYTCLNLPFSVKTSYIEEARRFVA